MADLQQEEAPANGAPPLPSETLAAGLGAKRHRRPSVRLGDIGEQPAAFPHDSNVRRSKQWKVSSSHHPLHPPYKESSSAAGAGWMGRMLSKRRPLTNLVSDDALEIPVVAEDKSLHSGEENLESMVVFRRGPKDGRARRVGGPAGRRVRTNWVSRVDEGMDAADLKSSGGEDAGDEGYRDYDDLRREDSESPFKEHSPSDRRAARVRISDSREVGPAATAEAADVDMPLETDDREWNNGRCRSIDDRGVRAWLSGLGLDRYAPLFKIHEVDDEVLPLLTLEDLKDMEINAVGSRRKIYCAIQKLRKNFT
uniref:Protein bicaudal C n=1 Tax=Anthurium amnicola TaxID=1678845 RepID=A0A1D1XWG3_9ARAE